eukprot:SAG22_NODE_33_length_27588_cov_104.174652_19_plen_150_part_00
MCLSLDPARTFGFDVAMADKLKDIKALLAREMGVRWTEVTKSLYFLPTKDAAKEERAEYKLEPDKKQLALTAGGEPLALADKPGDGAAGGGTKKKTSRAAQSTGRHVDDGRTAFALGFVDGSILEWEMEKHEVKKKLEGPVSTFDIMDY